MAVYERGPDWKLPPRRSDRGVGRRRHYRRPIGRLRSVHATGHGDRGTARRASGDPPRHIDGRRRRDAGRCGARVAIYQGGPGTRSGGRRSPGGDSRALGTASCRQPGVCDHRGAHLSNREVRDGTRKSLHSRRGRWRPGGDWRGADLEGVESDWLAIAQESIGMTDPAVSFEPHRRRLLGLAYRMLGSVSEAEDAVQDAYLRWHAADRDAV